MVKVYTKRGDMGETDLIGGVRTAKSDLRVDCYGTMDEVNAQIGMAYALLDQQDIKTVLRQVQTRLFALAAELATADWARVDQKEKISEQDVAFLEKAIDGFQETLTPAQGFVIPGGTPASAALHVARTVARRFERQLIRLNAEKPVNPAILKYTNRLSDALFVLARAEEENGLVMEIRRIVMNKLEMNGTAKGEFSLGAMKQAAQAAEKKAEEMGVPIVFAAVDSGGNLVLLHKMEGALLASVDIATNKAYTALALKTPTKDLQKAAEPGGALYGITTTNQSKIIAFGGGLPVMEKGLALGGIGVSGGTVEEDVLIVTCAMEALQRSENGR